MTEFWDFFLATESGNDVFKVLLVMAIGLVLVSLFTFAESKKKLSWLFLAGNSLTAAGVVVFLLIFGAGLAELLVWLLLFLLIRILFMMVERGTRT